MILNVLHLTSSPPPPPPPPPCNARRSKGYDYLTYNYSIRHMDVVIIYIQGMLILAITLVYGNEVNFDDCIMTLLNNENIIQLVGNHLNPTKQMSFAKNAQKQ